MKKERYSELARLALEVAMHAPLKFNIHGTATYIPRSVVLEIRKECERLGINWRRAKSDADQIRRDQQSKCPTTGVPSRSCTCVNCGNKEESNARPNQ